MTRYWVPATKKGLIDWLAQYYKEGKAKYKAMGKKQLYAMYFKTREALLCK